VVVTEEEPNRRPGGRSARVRAEVHQAVLGLLREQDPDELNFALVAERSGVHQATIYRRWGTLPALMDDVVTELLSRSSPLPDTGTLRGDLESYAVRAAEDVAGPLGARILRAVVLASPSVGERVYLVERERQLQAMFDRAAGRGEAVPTVPELLEVVLAPLYYRVLFMNQPASADDARTLVERLLVIVEGRPS
jgi:AcrR family transcriptional regulator